jgi:hypothetical protein
LPAPFPETDGIWILFPPVQEEGEMSNKNQVATGQTDPAKFFAEICAAYVEVLAGLRRPEQLSRWLTDTKTFATNDNAYQGVVVLQISGAIKAVSVRAELIHERFRITEMVLI